MYTKEGRPLRVSGNHVYGPNGTEIGRIHGTKVYGPDGRYVGTIHAGRLVYRSSQAGNRKPSFAAMSGPRPAAGKRGRRAMWGEEPKID